jgi:hypothetical protein
MSLVSAIIALCKAVPILERLFLQIADEIKEAKAKARYEDKLSAIDAAVSKHRLPKHEGIEWRAGTNESSSISKGSTIGTRLDNEGTKESGRIRIRT